MTAQLLALRAFPFVMALGVLQGGVSPIHDTGYDISGLVWLEGDEFLVVHDAKYPEEAARARAGLIRLRHSAPGLAYTPLSILWPDSLAPASDFESISAIPGSPYFMLAESGDDGGPFRRLFLVELADGELRVVETVDWPANIQNVEGMAIASAGSHLVFVYAERGHGQTAVDLHWAMMTIDPISFSEFTSVSFRSGLKADPNLRPISSLEIDRSGRIYAASAYDPNVDTGPFRSIVWEIGTLLSTDGRTQVAVSETPKLIAVLDGLKVEALAVREGRGRRVELFVGTDDESYGATLRPLPSR